MVISVLMVETSQLMNKGIIIDIRNILEDGLDVE